MADRRLPRLSAPPDWKPGAATPDGPVLGRTVIDEEIAGLAELARHYPAPPGYRYALTAWGQPVLEHGASGARFSLLIEEGMLAFDWKITSTEGSAFLTVDVERDGEIYFPEQWPLPPGDSAAGPLPSETVPPPIRDAQAPAPPVSANDWARSLGTRPDAVADPLRERVRRQLRHGTVWCHRDDTANYQGVRRALDETPSQAEAIAAAVVALLPDEDVVVRSGAVALLSTLGERVPAARVASVLQRHRALYFGVEAQGTAGCHYYEDLYSQLLSHLGHWGRPGDPEAVRLLRAAADAGFEAALPGLARLDADTLCRHAARLVRRGALLGLLRCLPTAAHRERFVRALLPWPADEREATLGRQAWDSLPLDPAEIAHLRALIADAD